MAERMRVGFDVSPLHRPHPPGIVRVVGATVEELERRGDDELYEVVIDAEFVDGSLTYGELHLPGRVEDEVLFSCHVCHPALANDGLSGIAVAIQLARYLRPLEHHYSYRFLFVPATIGAITMLITESARLLLPTRSTEKRGNGSSLIR